MALPSSNLGDLGLELQVGPILVAPGGVSVDLDDWGVRVGGAGDAARRVVRSVEELLGLVPRMLGKAENWQLVPKTVTASLASTGTIGQVIGAAASKILLHESGYAELAELQDEPAGSNALAALWNGAVGQLGARLDSEARPNLEAKIREDGRLQAELERLLRGQPVGSVAELEASVSSLQTRIRRGDQELSSILAAAEQARRDYPGWKAEFDRLRAMVTDLNRAYRAQLERQKALRERPRALSRDEILWARRNVAARFPQWVQNNLRTAGQVRTFLSNRAMRYATLAQSMIREQGIAPFYALLATVLVESGCIPGDHMRLRWADWLSIISRRTVAGPGVVVNPDGSWVYPPNPQGRTHPGVPPERPMPAWGQLVSDYNAAYSLSGFWGTQRVGGGGGWPRPVPREDYSHVYRSWYGSVGGALYNQHMAAYAALQDAEHLLGITPLRRKMAAAVAAVDRMWGTPPRNQHRGHGEQLQDHLLPSLRRMLAEARLALTEARRRAAELARIARARPDPGAPLQVQLDPGAVQRAADAEAAREAAAGKDSGGGGKALAVGAALAAAAAAWKFGLLS